MLIKFSKLPETRKNWICHETTNYKDLPVKSLAFSSDGSLLSVGCGNTLCIYIPEMLHIKCVLSPPAGLDGSANKVIVKLPTMSTESTSLEMAQKRRKDLVKTVMAFLKNTDDKLLIDIIEESKNLPMETDEHNSRPLSIDEEKEIFKGIMAKNELNFFQKLELFQKLDLHFSLPSDLKQKFRDYIRLNASVAEGEHNLKEQLNHLSATKKFIGHYKLQNYLERSGQVKGLHLKNIVFDDEAKSSKKHKNKPMETDTKPNEDIEPIRKVAQINHVVFGTQEYNYFVIVCTEKRLLIWNLLTSRLHAALKLSVKHIVVDPKTSLIAAFTVFDECK